MSKKKTKKTTRKKVITKNHAPLKKKEHAQKPAREKFKNEPHGPGTGSTGGRNKK